MQAWHRPPIRPCLLVLLVASARAAPLLVGVSISPSSDAWDSVREAIDEFPLVTDCVVSIGDSRGELFRHTKGATTFDTEMTIFSSTKWVSGVTIMSAVQEGLLSLDDPASQWLQYWTTDPADPRSRVTLRHLLSFTSGMSGSTACPAEMVRTYLACRSQIYRPA